MLFSCFEVLFAVSKSRGKRQHKNFRPSFAPLLCAGLTTIDGILQQQQRWNAWENTLTHHKNRKVQPKSFPYILAGFLFTLKCTALSASYLRNNPVSNLYLIQISQ